MVMNNVFSCLAQVSILYTVLFYCSLNSYFCDRACVTGLIFVTGVTESHPVSALRGQGWESGTTMPRMSNLL